MNLTAPTAVAALRAAFLDLLALATFPPTRAFLVTCGADVPFGRAAALMGLAGEAIAGINRVRARALYRDGVAPGADVRHEAAGAPLGW